MGEIVNLNQARKDRAKADRKARAAENRIMHGRTRAERQTMEKERERASRLLDGQKLED